MVADKKIHKKKDREEELGTDIQHLAVGDREGNGMSATRKN